MKFFSPSFPLEILILDSKTANTGLYDVPVYGIIVNEFGNTVHSITCNES